MAHLHEGFAYLGCGLMIALPIIAWLGGLALLNWATSGC